MESTGLEALTTAFTSVVGWMSDMVEAIIATPILLLPIGIFVAGGAIGLAKRLIGK